MSRGQRDFGQYAPKDTSTSISDMGEVAARLGSIVIFDKRGDVVTFDNFEEPLLAWEKGTVVGGDYVRFSSLYVKSGSQAVRLHCDNHTSGSAHINKASAVLASKRLGMEISFCQLSLDLDLVIYLWYDDAVKASQAEVKIDTSNFKLSVRDAAYAWVEVADIPVLQRNPFTFHTVKLVVDFDTALYQRVILNETEYDVSGRSIYVDTTGGFSQVLTRVEAQTRNGVGGDVWVDDFILTQEEP